MRLQVQIAVPFGSRLGYVLTPLFPTRLGSHALRAAPAAAVGVCAHNKTTALSDYKTSKALAF